MNLDKERASFEAWFTLDEGVFYNDFVEEYDAIQEKRNLAKLTQYSWEAWHARAAKPADAERVIKVVHVIGDSNDVISTNFEFLQGGGAGIENLPDGTILYMLNKEEG